MAAALLVLCILTLGLLVASATAKPAGKVIRDQRVVIKKQRQTITNLRALLAADTDARLAALPPRQLWRVVVVVAERIEAVAHPDYYADEAIVSFDTFLEQQFTFTWSGFNPAAALP